MSGEHTPQQDQIFDLEPGGITEVLPDLEWLGGYHGSEAPAGPVPIEHGDFVLWPSGLVTATPGPADLPVVPEFFGVDPADLHRQDADGDGVPDYYTADADHDGHPDFFAEDVDQNGVLEYAERDYTGDGNADSSLTDYDGDGLADASAGA